MSRVEATRAILTRRRRHFPKYHENEKAIEPTPYLFMPFRKEDTARVQLRSSQPGIAKAIDYIISDGWVYSKKTKKLIHTGHGAVDFALPYGFPITAPCSGYAMSSYYSYPKLDRKREPILRNGRLVSIGVGYFVQIYNQEHDRFVQLAHLSDVAEKIPFSVPSKNGARWEPNNHTLPKRSMISGNNPAFVKVEVGEAIGFLGYSGLTFEPDYKEGYERPLVIDPNSNGTYSIPHLHMDEFMRNYKTKRKDWRRDPYNVYARGHLYPTHTNGINLEEDSLFHSDEVNLPKFPD